LMGVPVVPGFSSLDIDLAFGFQNRIDGFGKREKGQKRLSIAERGNRMARKAFPLTKVYGLLEPEPGCLAYHRTVKIVEKVVGCGNTSGADIDKFEGFCLTPKPAARIGPPLAQFRRHHP